MKIPERKPGNPGYHYINMRPGEVVLVGGALIVFAGHYIKGTQIRVMFDTPDFIYHSDQIPPETRERAEKLRAEARLQRIESTSLRKPGIQRRTHG